MNWHQPSTRGLLGLAQGELEEHARFTNVECSSDVLMGL